MIKTELFKKKDLHIFLLSSVETLAKTFHPVQEVNKEKMRENFVFLFMSKAPFNYPIQLATFSPSRIMKGEWSHKCAGLKMEFAQK